MPPRKYYGVDAQLKIQGKADCFTELRGEFISGKQTAFFNSTATPDALPKVNDNLYIRKFNGTYYYYLQNIINDKNQLVLKYDCHASPYLIHHITSTVDKHSLNFD